jgi:hypothetical protein
MDPPVRGARRYRVKSLAEQPDWHRTADVAKLKTASWNEG